MPRKVCTKSESRFSSCRITNEEVELDAELSILEKYQGIATMGAELALAQGIPNEINCQPTFKDIKHSVLVFSGDEEYDTKSLGDSERAYDSDHGNLITSDSSFYDVS